MCRHCRRSPASVDVGGSLVVVVIDWLYGCGYHAREMATWCLALHNAPAKFLFVFTICGILPGLAEARKSGSELRDLLSDIRSARDGIRALVCDVETLTLEQREGKSNEFLDEDIGRSPGESIVTVSVCTRSDGVVMR